MEFDEIKPIKEQLVDRLMDSPLRHRNVTEPSALTTNYRLIEGQVA